MRNNTDMSVKIIIFGLTICLCNILRKGVRLIEFTVRLIDSMDAFSLFLISELNGKFLGCVELFIVILIDNKAIYHIV